MKIKTKNKRISGYMRLSYVIPLASTIIANAAISAQADTNANQISIPRNPLIASSHVDPTVLLAVDGSSAMKFEMLFGAQNHVYWRDGSFVTSNGDLRSSGLAYQMVFPNRTKSTIPPVPDYAFIRSPDFNRQYFSPTQEYRPWPGDTDYRDKSSNLTRVRYVPGKITGERDDEIDMTAITAGEFDYRQGMPKPDDCASVCNAGAYDFFPATFYLTGASKEDAQSRAGKYFSSYRTNKIKPSTSRAPGNTSQPFYRFQIKPDNFTKSADYRAAVGNFTNWFAYNRNRSGAIKNALVRAFNDFDHLNVGICTSNHRPRFANDVPYNLDDNRNKLGKRIKWLILPLHESETDRHLIGLSG
ncbi:hypothetical protein HKX42_02545 [Salinisphaera sp. USBA-960]|nr:hypothetical protein [Salifodinibacter halophilus]NNC25755.1 hypothetical protein [Salifodinibacter halophilus]